MGRINRSTFIEDEVDAAVQRIAARRHWSISQTIALLLAESPTLVAELNGRESGDSSSSAATSAA
jgi:hypothetical protein